jgi:hypothetical protein
MTTVSLRYVTPPNPRRILSGVKTLQMMPSTIVTTAAASAIYLKILILTSFYGK